MSTPTSEIIPNAPILKGDAFHRLEKKIFRQVGTAISDFSMIEEGDRILVAVSGGKDSWVLLSLLSDLKKRAPVNFEIIAVNIDQGYGGFRQDIIEDYLEALDIEYDMRSFDIASIVEEKSQGAVPCALCSRLRRGALYGYAEELKTNKIALGHHKDDLIETLLLNQFFNGRTASMAPKLVSDDQKNTVIRPLIYVSEADITSYSQAKEFPIVCCECPLACGESLHLDHKRRKIKELLKELEVDIPEIKNSLLSSLSRVNLSHMLDKDRWDH